MMTREKTRIARGSTAAIMLAVAVLAGCDADDTDARDDERIAGELNYPADTGREAVRDTPRPEPVDSSQPDTVFVHEPPWAPAECVAAVKPDRLQIQDEPMLITYAFDADFPEPDSVLADTNSGILVESLDQKLTLVRLNLSRAAEGRWMIRFLGAGNACDATLIVRRPS
jgi:hypothetical protein